MIHDCESRNPNWVVISMFKRTSGAVVGSSCFAAVAAGAVVEASGIGSPFGSIAGIFG